MTLSWIIYKANVEVLIVSDQFESSINGESFWLICILYIVFQGLILDFVPIYSEVRICNYPFLNCEVHGIMLPCCSFVCTMKLGHIWFSFLSLLLSCSKEAKGPFCGGKSSHTAELTIQFFCSWSLEHFHPGSPPDLILFKHDSFKHQEILWTHIWY